MNAAGTIPIARLALAARRAQEDNDAIGADPIAVVGIGCRFPNGGDSPGSYWRALLAGVDAIREVPADRWNADRYYDPNPTRPGRMNTRWGSFLDDVRSFDAAFFGIAAREAETLDPQQRLLLEVACEALDDAGQTAEMLRSSLTGVFFALHNTDYLQALHANRETINAYSTSGTVACMAPGRLSFHFDLRGPSMVIDTACSSSLVAIHQACESLRTRTSSLAVAAGASLVLSPERTLSLAKWGFMAPDGHCKPFDAAADGWVRGEGCGAVVLRRLADALAAGDRIWAVIRGTAVIQDGRSTVLTAPNGAAQIAVITAALENGRVSADDIGYIEAHGTGTVVGDPIEFEALDDAIGRSGTTRCLLGAVKANLGHLEAAAGIAGFIKTVLVLAKRRVPPQLHFSRLNPLLSFDGTRLRIAPDGAAWESDGRRRFAGVSAFGFSGTNAHVILEEAPEVPRAPEPPDCPARVLLLSGRSAASLRAGARAYVEALSATGDLAALPLDDVCYTAGLRRHHHEHRLAVVGADRGELVRRLDEWLAGNQSWTNAHGYAGEAGERGVVFVFSGQGSQWAGMGRTLLESEPIARQAFDECDDVVRALGGPSPREALWHEDVAAQLARTSIAQPALLAIQVALAAQLRAWGILPTAVVGHSVGEVAAAHISGALTLGDAARVVIERSRCMEAAAGRGRMLAASLSEADANERLMAFADRVAVAAINGSAAVVLSGDSDAIETCRQHLEGDRVRCQLLDVPYAFHSHQMVDACATLSARLHSLRPATTGVTFVSTVTGTIIDGETLTCDYWQRNAIARVQFRAAMATLVTAGHRRFVEIGPHPVLGGYINSAVEQHPGASVISTLHRQRNDRLAIRAAAGALHASGASVDLARVIPAGRAISLPSYQWDRQQYWAPEFDAAQHAGPLAAASAQHTLAGREISTPWTSRRIFETTVSAERPAWLGDHRIHGAVVVPAAAFLAMADAAGRKVLGGPPIVQDAFIHRPLVLDAGEVIVQIGVDGLSEAGAGFEICSRAPGDTAWTLHVSGNLRLASADTDSTQPFTIEGGADPVSAGTFYEGVAAHGIELGPAFRTMRAVRASDRTANSIVATAEDVEPDSSLAIHPALLDGCLHAAWTVSRTATPLVPVAFGHVKVRPSSTSPMLVTMRLAPTPDGAGWTADIDAHTTDADAVVEIRRLVMRPFIRAEGTTVLPIAHVPIERIAWREIAAAATASPTRSSWLVFADAGGIGDQLSRRLSDLGHQCEVVPAADARDAGSVGDLVQRLARRSNGPQRIVYLGALDACATADTADLLETSTAVCGPAMQLLRAAAASGGAVAELALITRGAQSVDRSQTEPLHALLWGLSRVADLELPDVVCRRIDLPPDKGDDASLLMEALLRESTERELASRAGAWRAPRLVTAATTSPAARPVALGILRRGSLDDLRLVDTQHAPPGPGEVLLRVIASGLNFRDVLNALDMYPGDAGPLGNECVGEVIAVGDGVADLAIGDQVVALGASCFATFVTTQAALTVKRPARLDPIEAATVPVAFLTADYALFKCARLEPGDRVLVHAAAGGVGIAAVQLALRAGATVFATAGSEEKRAFVRTLGVSHVASSRDPAFADEIWRATGGRGVNVIVNSLSGEFIPRSLDLLAPGGRFVELGKRDVWDEAAVRSQRPDVVYSVFQLGDEMTGSPATVRERLQSLLDQCAKGVLSPLPVRQFPLRNAASAFRLMARARHIGKIVIVAEHLPWQVRPDGAYLVTGGLGALGLHAARWLAARGARHIVLASRSAPAAPDLHDLEQLAEITVDRCDVTSVDEVRRLLSGFGNGRPRLRGIFHLAGEARDGVIVQQDVESFHAGLATKVVGTWNVHALTRHLPLDFFVCYSSLSGTIGAAGQSSYAAANAFIDALACARDAEGLPAVSVAWGAWDAGMAARLGGSDRSRLTADGMVPITAAHGDDVLDRLRSVDAAYVIAGSIDWTTYVERHPRRRTLLTEVLGSQPAPVTRHTTPVSPAPVLVERLARLRPADRRVAVVQHLRRRVGSLVGRPADREIDEQIGFREIGLDSLLAVELRNTLQGDLGTALPATIAFDFPTVATLSAFVLSALGMANTSSAVVERARSAPEASTESSTTELTDADAERLLERELEELDRQLGRETR